jgi:hypothetical protein
VKSDSRISVKTQELLVKRHGEIQEVERKETRILDENNDETPWFYII